MKRIDELFTINPFFFCLNLKESPIFYKWGEVAYFFVLLWFNGSAGCYIIHDLDIVMICLWSAGFFIA